MPPCESTSSIHRRPKRSKASILPGSMTYSTTQVIMPQASGALPAEPATRSAIVTVLLDGSDDRDIMRYHVEAEMTDVLIRDVPEEVVAALDAHAARLGLSRSEYVRRRLAQDAATPGSPVSVADLARFAVTFADLADPDVMSQAWT